MNTLSQNLKDNLSALKSKLSAEDILSYEFETGANGKCCVLYADGLVDKQFIAEFIVRPLSSLQEKLPFSALKKIVLFPEVKEETKTDALQKEVLDGNVVLLIDGEKTALIVGTKRVPARAVAEPPTDVAVKGPREGFIEEIKTNMALVRKRLKSEKLQFVSVKIGRRSQTNVAIVYLDGIAKQTVIDAVQKKLSEIDTDIIVDSSYISDFLADKKHSLFKQVGTTEKPDVFSAKIAEGRVGILVDGSPIALTVPFLFVEELQTPEDYFVSPFVSTVFRCMRLFALITAILLPAYYVASQLFALQLLPLGLTLTIASGVKGLPLSPSLEMFLVLLVLEILKEASIRMPKYVGMSLSVVGALVLGETAVSAGFVSTPAIIVVAFSGICLYTVPEFVETGSVLRWIFLIVAGSIGPFGIVVCEAFLLYYAVGLESFGAPVFAPFSPLILHDLKDSVVKEGMRALPTRPKVLSSPNKTRLKTGGKTK